MPYFTGNVVVIVSVNVTGNVNILAQVLLICQVFFCNFLLSAWEVNI